MASSSRRRAVKGLFALALAPACARRGGGGVEAAPAPGPRLALEGEGGAGEGGGAGAAGEGAGAAPGAAPRERDAVWLLLGALPEGARRVLVDDVAALMTAAEAKANPMLVNFLDEPPPASLFKARPWLGPALNAARALTCERWRLPGGGGAVRAFAAAAGPPGGASLAAWAPGQGEAERWRFAAWPASFGLLVRFDTAADARRGADALGARLASAGSGLGAVLGGPGAGPPPERVTFQLSARARRSADELVALARHLVEGPPPGPPCPWLTPGEGEAYVVPRLGALARHAEFVDEARRALRDGGVAARYYDGRRGGFERA